MGLSTASIREFWPPWRSQGDAHAPGHGLRSRLGRKLLWYVVLFSSAVTLINTGYQLYRSYERDLDGVESAFNQIATVHLRTLNQQLWAQNFHALKIQLDGMRAMQDIEALILQERDGQRIEVGERTSERAVVREIPMTYEYRGQVLQIGTLTAVASLDRIRSRLLHDAAVMLTGNAIKTFLVSGFVLILFYGLIGRHLRRLADYLNALSPDRFRTRFRLDRRPSPDEVDELDAVANAINSMGERLASSIDALRESEDRLTFLMAHATEGIIIHDGKSILNISPGACALLGGTPADFIGKDPQLTVAPAYRAMSAERIRRGQEDAFEIENIRLDGTTFPSQARARYSNYQGRRVRVVAFQDISERRAMETRLRESQKLEAIGILAGGIAHDFNNMLQIISGYTAIARASASSPESVKTNLDQAVRAAERAAGVTRQLLAFSRHEPIRAQTVDLLQLVDAQLRMLRPLLGERIAVEIEAAPDCPPVSADAGLIEQVLVNLCINARDAMPSGGTIRIGVRPSHTGEAVETLDPPAQGNGFAVITVADNGTGIPPEVRKHLFEPFFTTKARGKGTGLGLSTAYGIIREHGGTIDVHSEPGKGSTFRIFLPVAKTEKQEHLVKAPATANLDGDGTILVAEDEQMVRDLMGSMLQAHGYKVHAVADGNAALEAVAREPQRFDLVLLDMMMPQLDGFEAYERLQRIRPAIPVLFCTGYVDRGIDVESLLKRGVKLIRKPFSEEELLSAVRDALHVK